MEKDFWQRITRDETIRDYNTKAVNVDGYQRRDNKNSSDTAGKVENETKTKTKKQKQQWLVTQQEKLKTKSDNR